MVGPFCNPAWRCHTPNLLKEIAQNSGQPILSMPMTIFGHLLHAVAERAVELNDPQLNLLMMRMTLYENADPEVVGLEQAKENIIAAEAACTNTA